MDMKRQIYYPGNKLSRLRLRCESLGEIKRRFPSDNCLKLFCFDRHKRLEAYVSYRTVSCQKKIMLNKVKGTCVLHKTTVI